MSKSKTYNKIIKIDNILVGSNDVELYSELPPGMYELSYNPPRDEVAFIPMVSRHDKIVNLDSGEFAHILKDIQAFLKPETKVRFDSMGFLYKNSFLLHGKPGVGKTIIVNMLAKRVIEAGGVVLFDPDPRGLPTAYQLLEQIKPGTMVMVIFEELETHLEDHEGALLSILDGETQKDNVVYVATTNFICDIPARILRPGRFATVLEVQPPSVDMRKQYLESKDIPKTVVKEILAKTEGFTIDETKEVLRSVYCLDHDVDQVVARLKNTQQLAAKSNYVQDEKEKMLEKAEAASAFIWGVGGGRN